MMIAARAEPGRPAPFRTLVHLAQSRSLPFSRQSLPSLAATVNYAIYNGSGIVYTMARNMLKENRRPRGNGCAIRRSP